MSKDKSNRQQPLSEEEYKKRSKPRGAFATIWVPEVDELPYSDQKIASLANELVSKDAA